MKTAEDIIKDKDAELISIPFNKTILQACRMMVDNKIGAMLVEKNDNVVGIWTERDLLRNTLTTGFDPETAIVGNYMTTPLQSAPHDATVHKLEDIVLGRKIRHILVEKEGQYIGLLSVGDILRTNLIEKDKKFRELNTITSWDYYEDWKWGRKK